MKYLSKEETYEFKSGKKLSANRGIIGLSPEDENPSEGYDGLFCYRNSELDFDTKLNLTDDERIELAEYMIDLWTRWKNMEKFEEGENGD